MVVKARGVALGRIGERRLGRARNGNAVLYVSSARVIRLCLSAGVAALGLAGCSWPDSQSATESGTGSDRPPNARTARSATVCVAAEVQRLVEDFIDAFNRGDHERLERLFATRDGFKWYSTEGPGARLRADAYDRATLISYFARRHEQREQLRLQLFRFQANSGGYGHFSYRLVRSVDGFAIPYRGKGAAICDDDVSVIAVWSMGREA